MVSATMKDMSPGAKALEGNAGAGKKGRLRRKGNTGDFFAALLVKAAGQNAARKKTIPAGFRAETAPALRAARTENGQAGISFAPNSGETRETGAAGTEKKNPLWRAAPRSRREENPAAGKNEKERPSRKAARAEEIPAAPEPDPVYRPVQEAAKTPVPGPASGGETMARTPAAVPAPEGPQPRDAAENGKIFVPITPPKSGEGAKTAAPEKKNRKSEAPAESPRNGKDKLREELALKTEKNPEAREIRDLKTLTPEDPKQDSPRQELEIRVTVRAVDERYVDTIRTAEGRSVRESASGLLRHLREDGNDRIVRSARIILHDRNEGEIRLVLKPESLGEVKIRLSLQDNLIGGRILVENASVREVFERNLPDLASAFQANGFELGSLDVSVGNNGARESGETPGWFFEEQFKTAELERGLSSANTAAYYVSHLINIMA